MSVQVHYVRPSPSDDVAVASDSVLTEECRIQTNLPEDSIRNAQSLEIVIDEVSLHDWIIIDDFLYSIRTNAAI